MCTPYIFIRIFEYFTLRVIVNLFKYKNDKRLSLYCTIIGIECIC